MAEKTLNTRILLKYDTLARWSNSTLVLKKGEIAIATIPTADPANKHLPPVMFKVGDGTKTFAQLDWASGLAADVYTWAKAAVRPTYKYGDTDLTGFGTAATKNVGDFDAAGAAATAEANAKAYVDEQISAIPPAAEYTLETGATDGSLVLKKDGVAVGDPAVVKGWAELLAKAQKGIDDAATALAAAQAAQTTANGKYSKPANGIPKTDLAEAVQTSLGKADTALQNHQTVTLESGTNNGTVKITVNGTATDNVAVKGLKSAAYTESSAYATAAQGTKADNAMPKAGGAFTGAITVQAPTAEMNPATKQYVDTAINTVKQFEYQVVNELPTASQATMGKIYLVAHSHNPNDGQPDSYDEFITVLSGSTYKWERIGNTDIDLSGYVPTTRKINGKALTSDITLGAADVGVNETAFPGLKKVGTVTGVKMNAGSAISPDASGVVDLGTVITDISGKQDKLTANQLAAVNSGITATKVSTYDGYATNKQDSLNAEQLLAVNSGITAEKVGIYDGYADGKQDTITSTNKLSADLVSGLGAAAKKGVDTTIAANSTSANLPTSAAVENRINAHAGIDKVGTVTSVSTTADGGLKVTNGTTAAVIDIDDAVTFILDCGNSTL